MLLVRIDLASTVLDSLDSNLCISPATLNHHRYCNALVVSLLEGTDGIYVQRLAEDGTRGTASAPTAHLTHWTLHLETLPLLFEHLNPARAPLLTAQEAVG